MRIHSLSTIKCISSWSALALALIALNNSVLAQEHDPQQVLRETEQDPARIQAYDGHVLYDSAMYQLQLIAQKQQDTQDRVQQASQFPSVSDILHIISEFLGAPYSFHGPAYRSYTSNDDPAMKPDTNIRSATVDAKVQQAIHLLEEAAMTHHHNDALYTLADIHFYAKYNNPRNYSAAFRYYSALATRTGNATAQQQLGFMYATGIGNAVKRDQAKALVYHTFAAYGGDIGASLTLGYRYIMGIGTEQSCPDALYYYREVANKGKWGRDFMAYYQQGPPGGPSLSQTKIPIWDEKGGLFGSSASAMSSSKRHDSANIEEILHMYHTKAENRRDRDPQAQMILGQIYYQGSSVGTSVVHRNMKEAFKFFNMVARQFFPDNEDTNAPEVSPDKIKLAGKAAGMLGRMYWRGEGVEKNLKKAKMWFMRGTQLDDPASTNGLGEMLYDGSLGRIDRDNAKLLFQRAADREYDDAQVNLAGMYITQGEYTEEAIALLKLASQKKNLRALYMLGNIYSSELSSHKSCVLAVTYYKMLAERGDWLYSTFDEAYYAYMRDDYESATLYYMMAAEKGYELAQSNVAWLLDERKIGNVTEAPKNKEAQEHALIYWTRAANQNNVDARVKMGDCYFHGIGTPTDYEKAASCYQVAAEMERSPLAMWNLAWMYENGVGIVRDFHLAKRWYDSSLHYNRDAYLVVKLSLIKLHIRYYWNYWFGAENVGLPLSSPPPESESNSEDQKFTSWTAWWKNAVNKKNEIQRKVVDDNRPGWDIGQEGEHLARQYDKHRRQSEMEDEEGLFEGGTSRDVDDEDYSEEDELVESLMILGLCVLVGWLVYVRQFRFQNPIRDDGRVQAAAGADDDER